MERVIETFLELVKIPSPSRNERQVADYIIQRLLKLGLSYEEDDTGNAIKGNCGNIIVHLKGEGTPILFDAHMDTVLPCDCIRPIVKDDVIYSDGTSILGSDDKSGIAAMLTMLETIVQKKLKHPDITCVFSVCEEDGLQGVKHLDNKHYEDCVYAYVLDGEDVVGSVVSKTPHGCKGILQVIGKEAHAGVCPQEGVNALVVASEAITKLTIGRINEGLTCNIGIVHGGTATNVVMGKVDLSFEARGYEIEELTQFIAHVKEVFQTTCEHHHALFQETLRYGTPGYTIGPEEAILTSFQDICTNIGLPFQHVACGGGSHANIYQMNGIAALCVGTNMKHVHSLQESIGLQDLMELRQLLMGIVAYMSK